MRFSMAATILSLALAGCGGSPTVIVTGDDMASTDAARPPADASHPPASDAAAPELPICTLINNEQLVLIQPCRRADGSDQHTATGLGCYVCRDYAGCVAGLSEAATYCVSTQLACADPACAY